MACGVGGRVAGEAQRAVQVCPEPGTPNRLEPKVPVCPVRVGEIAGRKEGGKHEGLCNRGQRPGSQSEQSRAESLSDPSSACGPWVGLSRHVECVRLSAKLASGGAGMSGMCRGGQRAVQDGSPTGVRFIGGLSESAGPKKRWLSMRDHDRQWSGGARVAATFTR